MFNGCLVCLEMSGAILLRKPVILLQILKRLSHILLHAIAGYYSWRNTTKGSWFVQSLCEELRRRAHSNDILTILTFVSQRVAIDYESNVPDSVTMHRQKQIPCIMSMLTRLLQFRLQQ